MTTNFTAVANATTPSNGTLGGIPPEALDGFSFSLYHYTPSLFGAIICVGVFAILSALHTWRLLHHRAYYFTAFTLGGYFQVLGYAGRIWSHYDQLAIGGFVIQAILILVAPALYAASIYMILGRLIRALRAEDLSVIPVAWLTRIFVIADVVSFTLQAGGGGVQAGGTLELYHIGEKLIIVGLFVQIIMFGLFTITAITFHMRFTGSGLTGFADARFRWQRHLYVLYSVSVLIFVRSIFRVIEYLQGNGGYLISHEYFLFVFDAALMAITMAIFLVWYVDDIESRPCFADIELSSTTLDVSGDNENKTLPGTAGSR